MLFAAERERGRDSQADQRERPSPRGAFGYKDRHFPAPLFALSLGQNGRVLVSRVRAPAPAARARACLKQAHVQLPIDYFGVKISKFSRSLFQSFFRVFIFGAKRRGERRRKLRLVYI